MSQGDNKKIVIQLQNSVFLPEVVKFLEEGHTITLRLKGYSMRPFLENERDKALLNKAGALKVGDPVLAEISHGHFVLHRIVSISGDDVTLLGDGNLSPEHCKSADIKGSVIGFYRKGRGILDRTDGRKWLIYSWFWMRLLPVRRYLLAIHRRMIRIPVLGRFI